MAHTDSAESNPQASTPTHASREATAIRRPSAQEAAMLHELDSLPAPRPTKPESGEELEENLVSKHPDATIPESDISLADIEKQRSKPARWIVGAVLILVALVAPYWIGRFNAVHHTDWVINQFDSISSRGIAFFAWAICTFMFVSLTMMIVDRYRIFWFSCFTVLLCAEQYIAGVSLLKFNFWYSTYVVYGDSAKIANAANLGIIASAIALAVFAILWVGILVTTKKESPLNVLTHVWTSLIMLFVCEVIGILIVLFGGFLTVV